MHLIYVVSDGTGSTARQALSAALTQFANIEVKISVRRRVRTEDEVRAIVKEASREGALIVHTLVSDELRDFIFRTGRHYNVETMDLMGPLLARLSQELGANPTEKPGLFRQLNEAYFRRVETMEFAFQHDDGRRIHELPKSEIVLVGVSRTFKTPLSIFLAFKGWLVANVPIVLDFPPPPILFEIPPERVFCMNTNPGRLAMLRRSRHEHLGGAVGEYADPDYVRRELMYAMGIFRGQPKWSVINVTDKPIEEIASEILAIVNVAQYRPAEKEPKSAGKTP
jgi:regulator of PEP synthase PpsR (kinase-PPPase family)